MMQLEKETKKTRFYCIKKYITFLKSSGLLVVVVDDLNSRLFRSSRYHSFVIYFVLSPKVKTTKFHDGTRVPNSVT